MIRLLTTVFIVISLATCSGQKYGSSTIFAHNDYVRASPFYTAYDLEVGYIEADVFLVDDQLMVAHHAHEIKEGKTLEKLYLEPLVRRIKKNNGSVYQDSRQRLTLMIDLKTEGISTLTRLANVLQKYSELITCSSLQFMISGNVPAPDTWDKYPGFIYFDGRPGIAYTSGQLKRVSMISTNFQSHVKWDGRAALPDDDKKKILGLINDVHAKGKKIRFWATPDFENAWKELMSLNVDVIVTDDVAALANYLKTHK